MWLYLQYLVENLAVVVGFVGPDLSISILKMCTDWARHITQIKPQQSDSAESGFTPEND